MQCLEHPVEKLRSVLLSTRKDLIEAYEQYSREEKCFLDAGLLPGSLLFTAITVHSDSDWISAHPEAPQDFQSFYSNPYRSTPDTGHKTIYIQTIGSFGDGAGITEQYVEWLREYCEAFYNGLTVKLLPAVTVAASSCTFRVNSNTNNLQLHAGDLLAFLKQRKPKDAFCIVGITMIDLYPKDSWNFVFGQASLTEGMGVFSFARYDDDFYKRSYAGRLKKAIKLKPGDYSVFQGYYTPPISSILLLRSCKTLTHEIGHIFGIKHCQWLQCVMQGSNHLEESDRRPLDLCPICLRKLQCAIRFKIADRYKALLQWIDNGTGNSDQQSGKPTLAFQDFRQWLIKCLSILADESI
ncbi:archaemetzincin-2 isoform X1 [Ictalurus punctatus]|uniref:Archaemetzincin-2 n=1 Tax=Ictalurus punctatus TaxID=7998 RepID=W5ULJ9_ICTPU|nr:archaemetzincin-2 isoform X1 [Ictalurus punctatus]XP_053540967.1 archaemetzincin-2 isoform X1 [Ictalurus punctatus]XP_053540968.1 archaemetzincin-2 isoform X1 [Ictalurus punctatus]XP_053540969.1 archaemetzincin-2 isoform X1 [Ictalurus punctatus]